MSLPCDGVRIGGRVARGSVLTVLPCVLVNNSRKFPAHTEFAERLEFPDNSTNAAKSHQPLKSSTSRLTQIAQINLELVANLLAADTLETCPMSTQLRLATSFIAEGDTFFATLCYDAPRRDSRRGASCHIVASFRYFWLPGFGGLNSLSLTDLTFSPAGAISTLPDSFSVLGCSQRASLQA